jgi:hypothetical protein
MAGQSRPTRRRSRRAGLLGAALAALVATAPGRAGADRSFDVVMTPPAVDAYGMAVIDRAQTPQRFEFGMQAQFGWAYSPLRLTLADPHQSTLPDAQFRVIEQQYNVDLGFFLGLADFLSVAAALPMAVNVYDDNALGSANELILPTSTTGMGTVVGTGMYQGLPRQNISISNVGPRDPRLSLKARFYGGRWFEIGMLLEGTLPIGNSDSFMGDKTATFRPRLLMGVLLKRVVLALSFGAIIRGISELDDPYRSQPVIRLQVGHELTWGAGLSVKAHRMLGLGVESVGTVPVTGDVVSPTALLLGSLYFQPVDKFKLMVSGGGGLISSSPRNADGRVLVGLSYSLSPRAGGLL